MNTVHTVATLVEDFRRAGLHAGQTVLMHTSMRAIGGEIVGGANAVVEALMTLLTPEGTLVMPSHSSDNTDPATWRINPPPPEQWDAIRAAMPPYQSDTTPTNRMSTINECFRTVPGVLRSSHPAFSFCAWGKHAGFVIADQSLDNSVAEQSPTARVYDLDGWVFLLGVGHGNNTSLHLADYRAQWVGKQPEFNGSAMLIDGKRVWVTYRDDAIASDDFDVLGAAFEQTGQVKFGQVGEATTRLMRQRPLVDFAMQWMEANRPASLQRQLPP
jgi:aminoglycoside 3-N-acetyltransferase